VAWFGTIRQLLARFGMIWHGFAYAGFFTAVLSLVQLSGFETAAPNVVLELDSRRMPR
jgi:hypothetical protein